MWTCFVDSSAACAPTLQVARLDTNEKRRGFEYQYATFYRPTAGGAETRDLYTVKGVRLLITTRGEGKRVSISAIMLQISSGIALLWLANFAADFLMLHVLPERKHYRTYKQERTPDFSDLRNKIAEVEGEKKKLRDRKNRFAAKLDES
jgi:ATP P2X receptor.